MNAEFAEELFQNFIFGNYAFSAPSAALLSELCVQNPNAEIADLTRSSRSKRLSDFSIANPLRLVTRS